MQTKSLSISIIISILVVAGLMDLKYKGLLFRMLPASMQGCLEGNDATRRNITGKDGGTA
ncbi:hypothetical protein WMZ97_01120 [Lentibacillus sp. N15]|uniref:hypothetical protein n=1 Tax=Lentibacillus songyuanensis TaxID=3136161 RepID=UPI0031BBA516